MQSGIERNAEHEPYIYLAGSEGRKSHWLQPRLYRRIFITLAWMLSSPFFHWSDTWQLIIHTLYNIVAMLILFLIQNTQNRDTAALQLKRDELLRAMHGAPNASLNWKNLPRKI